MHHFVVSIFSCNLEDGLLTHENRWSISFSLTSMIHLPILNSYCCLLHFVLNKINLDFQMWWVPGILIFFFIFRRIYKEKKVNWVLRKEEICHMFNLRLNLLANCEGLVEDASASGMWDFCGDILIKWEHFNIIFSYAFCLLLFLHVTVLYYAVLYCTPFLLFILPQS